MKKLPLLKSTLPEHKPFAIFLIREHPDTKKALPLPYLGSIILTLMARKLLLVQVYTQQHRDVAF